MLSTTRILYFNIIRKGTDESFVISASFIILSFFRHFHGLYTTWQNNYDNLEAFAKEVKK
ncbi:MAG TPA: hypothetical protein DCZ94_12465 [Lentisphaeria bacterium]|nr:MAG: hypothetical protein A2X48_03915 [Lentisphaerae bacterium GWF2_49_21]HBC87760.1 hypothetical protein [Lentisphaeria bacterium]